MKPWQTWTAGRNDARRPCDHRHAGRLWQATACACGSGQPVQRARQRYRAACHQHT